MPLSMERFIDIPSTKPDLLSKRESSAHHETTTAEARNLDDDSEQSRLHQKVTKFLGSIEGSNSMRAEQARRRVRLRVSRNRARRRVR